MDCLLRQARVGRDDLLVIIVRYEFCAHPKYCSQTSLVFCKDCVGSEDDNSCLDLPIYWMTPSCSLQKGRMRNSRNPISQHSCPLYSPRPRPSRPIVPACRAQHAWSHWFFISLKTYDCMTPFYERNPSRPIHGMSTCYHATPQKSEARDSIELSCTNIQTGRTNSDNKGTLCWANSIGRCTLLLDSNGPVGWERWWHCPSGLPCL